jgi:hypothetical protein
MAEDNGVDRDGLMQAAVEADNSDTPLPADTTTETKAKDETPESADTPGDKPENKETPKQDGSLEKDGAKKSKFAAENERKTRTWAEINAEREAIKAEKAEIQRMKAEAEEQRKEWAQKKSEAQAVQVKDEHGYTAEDYERAAKEFRENDEWKHAEAATARAQKLRQEAAKQQFTTEFNKVWSGLAKDNPDLGNPSSELFKAVQDVMTKNRVLQSFPEGVRYATEWVKLTGRVKDYDTVKTELEKAKQQLEELNKKLAPSGGRVLESKSDGEVPFEKMTPDQRSAKLMKLAKEADGIE